MQIQKIKEMTDKEKIEFSQFVIGRYDHYYDSVNNKANFWLAFNSFLIGAVVTTYKDVADMMKNVSCLNTYKTVALLFIVVTTVSIIFIVLGSLPHTSSGGRSIIFFGDVAEIQKATYLNKVTQIDKPSLSNDYNEQVHELAKGLKKKYWYLKWSGRLMLVELGLFIVLIVMFSISQQF